MTDAEPYIHWETLILMPANYWLLAAAAAYLAVTVAVGVVWGIRRRPRRIPPPAFRTYTADDLVEIFELEEQWRLKWREELRP